MLQTIEDFQEEMKNCENAEQMNSVIEKMLDSPHIDVTNRDVKEIILEYRAQLEDYRKEMQVEEDKNCNRLIESGKCELYLCKMDVQWWKAGNRYYVQVDDNKAQALENLKEVMDRLKPEVIERINSMKPLIWIISDKGIGTLKSRHLFTRQDGEVFENYFEKL